MRGVRWCAVLIAVGGLSVTQHAWAQPQIVNARPETLDAGGGLTAALNRLVGRDGPLWVAWQVPAEASAGGCCWEWPGCEGCRLEPAPAGTAERPPLVRASPLPLEGDRNLLLLVRIDAHRIDRLRTVGASCPLDAGGLPFVTLTSVAPAQSLAWLRTLVDRSEPTLSRRVSESAIHAISRHADAGAVTMLLELARKHAEPRVRGSALVSLAQVAGRRLGPEIAGFVDSDPDTEVKKRAVFAVSQLPKDEGVPLLIKIARDHTNQAVRRQAVFWLGQSMDPRAIDFFASVLK
jgi:hypothetical protein